MKKAGQIRQGDVLLLPITKLSEASRLRLRVTGTKEDNPHAILAFGEATGHMHRVAEPDKVSLWRSDGRRFLQVDQPTSLVHEEHHPVALPFGLFEVLAQREYDPLLHSRRVLD